MKNRERGNNTFRFPLLGLAKIYIVVGLILPTLLAIRFIRLPVYDYIGEIGALGEGSVEVVGIVSKDTIKGNQRRLIISDVSVNGIKVHSSLFVSLPRVSTVGRWAEITLRGTIRQFSEPTVEQFTENVTIASLYYPEVLAIKTPTGVARMVNSIQNKLVARIRFLLPEPHTALLGGIVFGIEAEMTEKFSSLLKSAGLIHIVVASGFNALIVGNVVLRITHPFRKTLRLVIFSFLMFLYVSTTGFQVPIIRAAIMTFGTVLAQLKGENKQSLWWLLLSAYVLLLYRPQWLFSLSFQLSFVASLGIILLGDVLNKIYVIIPSIVREDTAATFSAQVFTLPLLYFRIGTLTLAGFVTNPLVLWTIVPIMYLGTVAVFLSFLSLPLAKILILPVWVLLDLVIFVTDQIAAYA